MAFAFVTGGLQCQGHDFCKSPVYSLIAIRWLLLLQASHSYSGQEEGKRGDVRSFYQENKRFSQKSSSRLLLVSHWLDPYCMVIPSCKGVLKLEYLVSMVYVIEARAKQVKNDYWTSQPTVCATNI